jgi:hypothetical protein
VLEERGADNIKQFDQTRLYEMGDALEGLARGILAILSRRDLTGHREPAPARAVSQVSANALAPTKSPWAESDDQYYHRIAGKVYATDAVGASEHGPRAETTPCEHGCGQAMRRDSFWCGGCGPGSWVCRCSRISASCENLCRNRF